MGKLRLSALFAVAMAASAVGNHAGAQRIYYDALAFDLRGNVKECSFANELDVNGERIEVYRFNADGAFTSYDAKVVRNEAQLPIEITTTDNDFSLGLIGTTTGEGIKSTTNYDYWPMSLGPGVMGVKIYKAYDNITNLEYNEDGSCKYAYLDLYNSKGGHWETIVKYDLLEFDSHGNWTRRGVSFRTEDEEEFKFVFNESRKITYWDDGSPDSSVVDVFFGYLKKSHEEKKAKERLNQK